jgi:cobalt-zinc-cadmium efflux system membrane fusion protein
MNDRFGRPAGGRSSTLTLVFTAAVALAGCGSREASNASPAPTPASIQPVASETVALTVEEVKAGGITDGAPQTSLRASHVTASAILQLDDTRTARVGSLVDGVVVGTPVQIGTRVARGARLANIHSHMVHEAWAEYRRAVADRRRATTELAFVKEAEARASRLLVAKAASRQEVERAQTDHAAAVEALVIAESEVRRAQDELEHLGITPEPNAAGDPEDSVPVSATVGGVVLERLVTAGTAVTAGMPLFVISDVSHLWAIAEVDEGQLSAISSGRVTELSVAAYPNRTFQGRIIAIGDSVNPETRRVTVRIEVANREGLLKPQMFASVRLPGVAQQRVVTVPAAAVQKIGQQPVVFVAERPGRFLVRKVKAGAELDGHVEIHEGLTGNERVAITGTFLLKSKFLEAGRPE